MQLTQNEQISKKEYKALLKKERDQKMSELREYYTKVPNTSKNGKEYINLKKRYPERVSFKKNTQTIASLIKFHEEGNKVVLWPIGVK